ncbi:hypothetical protein A2333_02870 [Candidatus Wolfebacteria bacterium RIFOXYB2_FULL_49_7]|uniref:Radical SAM core domain-containing protein n=1 Tax=Candidatus Wolfebacteria bacterium RIFOXYB1_FULL_54_12 TaxID=1802559 RepID=A0A1F8DXV1_9BACT|nr:MAG: hypothetical protein A2372_03155 [Candidatus Wolfebacteria bacterium RIFOXYB1_FULL_54_12]OGM96707.1 MAG: hypothetical protein A2333_02870 [Candidatus Wolfebacteria bacterium RIFOXYB2_FULL_49_7]
MALGFEGSKGILTEDGESGLSRNIRPTFQELTWWAARRELSFDEFILEVRRLPLRMSVSAFANDRCDFGCPYCYLRKRDAFSEALPTAQEIASIANEIGAADFSIVGMEPLETWDRTKLLLQSVMTNRKAMITNTRHLTPDIARWLGENDIRTDFSIGGSKKGYEATLQKARLLADAGVKATASCIVSSGGVNPYEIIKDISGLGFPMMFFPLCDIGELAAESNKRFSRFMNSLWGEKLTTPVMGKTDFLSPDLLRLSWKEHFGVVNFSDLRIDLDEGFLVRQISKNLLFGVYPFPGEFINRIRIDADGALTTCQHMQVSLRERMAVVGSLRLQPARWLELEDISAYHRQYWENYRRG